MQSYSAPNTTLFTYIIAFYNNGKVFFFLHHTPHISSKEQIYLPHVWLSHPSQQIPFPHSLTTCQRHLHAISGYITITSTERRPALLQYFHNVWKGAWCFVPNVLQSSRSHDCRPQGTTSWRNWEKRISQTNANFGTLNWEMGLLLVVRAAALGMLVLAGWVRCQGFVAPVCEPISPCKCRFPWGSGFDLSNATLQVASAS